MLRWPITSLPHFSCRADVLGTAAQDGAVINLRSRHRASVPDLMTTCAAEATSITYDRIGFHDGEWSDRNRGANLGLPVDHGGRMYVVFHDALAKRVAKRPCIRRRLSAAKSPRPKPRRASWYARLPQGQAHLSDFFPGRIKMIFRTMSIGRAADIALPPQLTVSPAEIGSRGRVKGNAVKHSLQKQSRAVR